MNQAFQRQRRAPDSAFVDANDPTVLLLGEAQRHEGTWASVGLPWRALCHPLHITGPAGSGKSALLQHMFMQRVNSGSGGVLITSQGTPLVHSTLAQIPLVREQDVTILVLGKTITVTGEDLHTPLNLVPPALHQDRGIALPQHAAIIEAFASVLAPLVDHPQWLRPLIQMAAKAVLAGEQSPTLAHIGEFLRDTTYRRQICTQLAPSDVQAYWEHQVPSFPAAMQATLASLGQVFEQLGQIPELADLVQMPDCVVDMRRELDQQRLVLVQAAVPSSYATLVLTHILAHSMLAAFSRAADLGEDRPDWQIMIDDANLALPLYSDITSMIMSRLTRLGIGVTIAHRHLHQFTSVSETNSSVPASVVFGAASTLLSMGAYAQNRVILGADERDAATYAADYADLGLSPADFVELVRQRDLYLKLAGCGNLFHARQLQSLQPLHEPDLPSAPQEWKTVRASVAGPQDAVSDAMITEVAALAQIDREAATTWLGHVCRDRPALFRQYCARTKAHRLAQRQFILQYPGCIRDKTMRIQILSALNVGKPSLETAAEQWSLIGPAGPGDHATTTSDQAMV